MERTISATPRHSEDELKQLFTKTLKLSSLWYAYEMLKDDSDFCDLPFSEQFYELGKVCHQKRLDNKYRLLKKTQTFLHLKYYNLLQNWLKAMVLPSPRLSLW